MWEWVDKNNGSLALFFSVLTAALALYHYLSIKKSEERDRRFANYHKLVEDLNGDGKGGSPFIDRQIVIVFEMRNFPEYYPVTLRILKRSLKRWEKLRNDTALASKFPLSNVTVNTLVDEAVITINFIERKLEEKSYLCNPEDGHL